MIVLFIVLEAFGFAMVMPRRDSLMAIFVNPQERARMVCIINVLITVFAMPFGYISGWLSSMDRRLPFMLAITMVVAAFALVTSMKVDMHKDSESKLGDV
jgi:MFS family permease